MNLCPPLKTRPPFSPGSCLSCIALLFNAKASDQTPIPGFFAETRAQHRPVSDVGFFFSRFTSGEILLQKILPPLLLLHSWSKLSWMYVGPYIEVHYSRLQTDGILSLVRFSASALRRAHSGFLAIILLFPTASLGQLPNSPPKRRALVFTISSSWERLI